MENKLDGSVTFIQELLMHVLAEMRLKSNPK